MAQGWFDEDRSEGQERDDAMCILFRCTMCMLLGVVLALHF